MLGRGSAGPQLLVGADQCLTSSEGTLQTWDAMRPAKPSDCRARRALLCTAEAQQRGAEAAKSTQRNSHLQGSPFWASGGRGTHGTVSTTSTSGQGTCAEQESQSAWGCLAN